MIRILLFEVTTSSFSFDFSSIFSTVGIASIRLTNVQAIL